DPRRRPRGQGAGVRPMQAVGPSRRRLRRQRILMPDAPEAPTRSATAPLLDVRGLCTRFATETAALRAGAHVSLSVAAGATLGIVGESGSGKSVTALSLLRLVRDPPGRIVAGQVLLRGRDLLQLDERQMQAVRGGEIGMIFQEPMTSLNPVMTTGA